MTLKEGAPCGAFHMIIGASVLTFIVTALMMSLLYVLGSQKRLLARYNRLLKENDKLYSQLDDYKAIEQRCRETSAYDKGLYDGRATDAYYRQCLKKLSANRQTDVILNGAKEEDEDE